MFTASQLQKQKAKNENIAVLHYMFTDDQRHYLNFVAKLTIGVKADNKHIQYCINKVEV